MLSLVPPEYPVPTSYSGNSPKKIYVSFLQKKLDDLINNRQADPLYRVRLHNTGRFNDDTLPESYYDLQSINADPPAPGTPCPPGYNEPVNWPSSPSSLGQEYHSSFGDFYFDNLNSQTLKVNLDTTSPTPFR